MLYDVIALSPMRSGYEETTAQGAHFHSHTCTHTYTRTHTHPLTHTKRGEHATHSLKLEYGCGYVDLINIIELC